jgi:hypothetical protein
VGSDPHRAQQRIPGNTYVIRIDISDTHKRYWLLTDHGHLEVCLNHPNQNEDGVLRTDSLTLTKWHLGEISLRRAIRDG